MIWQKIPPGRLLRHGQGAVASASGRHKNSGGAAQLNDPYVGECQAGGYALRAAYNAD